MMQLKSNQMYLENEEQYALVCRLAQVRVQRKALAVEEAQLETAIRTMMEPVTELVDVAFLNQQHELTEGELSEMFVARINAVGQVEVHPAYVSNRFRPDSNTAEAPMSFEEEKTTFSSALPTTKENEEEREGSLTPAPLSLEEKEEERERQQQHQQQEKDAAKQTWKIDPKGFIRFFNDTMTEAHAAIPLIKVLRSKRLEAINARSREYGKEALIKVIRAAARSEFLNGGGNCGWVASIDWMMSPNNFVKIMEGQFWNKSKKLKEDTRRRINRELYEADMEEKRQAREEAAAQAATIEQLREIFGEDFGR